jgi:hypothetical protein
MSNTYFGQTLIDAIGRAVRPVKPVDPIIASFTGLNAQRSIVDGLCAEFGRDWLASLLEKVETKLRLSTAGHTALPEVTGRVKYQAQLRRAADRARKGEPPDPENDWAEIDHIESAQEEKAAYFVAAAALAAEIAPDADRVCEAWCRYATLEIQMQEAAEAEAYARFGLDYTPSRLTLTLRSCFDYAKSQGLREILTAAAK